MKRWLAMLAGASIAVSASVLAATPEQEKQFVDTYRKAYDAKDAKTLNATACESAPFVYSIAFSVFASFAS